MIEKNVKLWIGDGPLVTVRVSQFDTMWRFIFSIVNNSQPWEIPSGASAVLNGRKPDGNVFAFSGAIENNTVTVDAGVQMTAVAGQTVCELSIMDDGKVVGTANFVLDVEEAPKSADDVVSDTVLDGYGMMVTNAVDSWLNSHSGQIGGLTNEAKQALLTLLAHVAYTDDQGQTYLDALETALYPPVDLLSISAVFNQGDNVIYDTDSLDSLKQYMTVTANMSDGTTQTVTNYTLSGALIPGTSTITVSYGGKNTTFDVVVTQKTTFTLSGGDFSIQAGAVSWDSTHDIYTNTSDSSLTKRRSIYINEGVKPYNTTENDSAFFVTDPPQYPIPIPANATGVTYSIVPNTQFMGVALYSYDESTGTYTREEDIGWKQGTYTVNFTAGRYSYLTSAFKYNSAGNVYQTEPTEVTIQFLTN